jgi:hypothetical protein
VDYKRHLTPSFPSKSIFMGTVTREGDMIKDDVVIKFTHMYCKSARDACRHEAGTSSTVL